MEKLKYAEIVIQEVHSKTIHGALQWKDDQRSVAAQATPAIRVSIDYEDDGPDAAVWVRVMIWHPVGRDPTMIGNPASPKARLSEITAAGQMLNQVNEIFRQVLLDPRKREFEAAMQQLREA